MKKSITVNCARSFIAYIGAPGRKSKRVYLLDSKCSGALDDPIWIRGALTTTALRKRPQQISKPTGSLGYKDAFQVAEKSVSAFISNMRTASGNDYTDILMCICKELAKEVSKLGIYWSFGRSQKFFNILTKYWYCVAVGYHERLEQNDLEFVESLSSHFHAPVDSITLRHIKADMIWPPLKGVYWGWNMDNKTYLSIQDWISKQGAAIGLTRLEYELIKIWPL